jgi:hypothetical protein
LKEGGIIWRAAANAISLSALFYSPGAVATGIRRKKVLTRIEEDSVWRK